jgi:hypothetical protein
MNAVGDSTRFALERRHAGIVILILLGAVLRFAFLVGYRPAFWFYGDSFTYLHLAEQALEPHPMRPLGYVVLLKVLASSGRGCPRRC